MADASNVEKLLASRHYKTNHVPQPENVIFRIANKNIGSLGNFIIFSGLPKAGKSTFINAAISNAFVKDKPIYQMELNIPKKKNLGYFDTESNEFDFYKNLDRIKTFSKVEKLPVFFNAFSTREDEPEVNRQMIELYIEKWKPAALVVDGMLDLVNDFNDVQESRAVISWLKRITKQYNTLIIGVVHLGKKDGHTLGHFGSMLDRYAQSIVEVVKDKENALFLLKSKMLRSADDFDDIAIMWNGYEFVEVLAPPHEKQKRSR